jgi:hypothetical protein
MDIDFESKRKALLKDLSSLKRENSIKRKLSSIKNSKNLEENTPEQGAPASHSKPVIAVYGKQAFFMRSFLQSVKNLCDVTFSEQNEEIINQCLEKSYSAILIDMDEPTDWRMSTDIFSSVKTINPRQRFALLTSKPDDPNVEVLLHKGAVIIRKPVNIGELMDFVKA